MSEQHFISYSPEFDQVLGKNPKFYLVIETSAHEGPVYVKKENALYFTTTPVNSNVPIASGKKVEVNRLDLNHARFPLATDAVSTVLANSNVANGMTLDRDGNLLICEQGTKADHARISRLCLDNRETSTVVEQWRGLRFNSPNDVVVKSDNSVWFTDPSYGALQGFKNTPLIGDYVYRYDPHRDQVAVVADSFNKPNGLAFSADQSIIYINDSGAIQGPGSYFPNLPHHIKAFDVVDGQWLSNERLFAVISPGIPDGLKVDSEDRVYSSSASGVQVFSSQGLLLGEILAPGVANFTFGGREGNTLYMLADSVIWAAEIAAQGA